MARRHRTLYPPEPTIQALAPAGTLEVARVGVALSSTIWDFVHAEEEVVLVFGPRREGKTVGGVAGILAHAERNRAVRPIRWAVVRDTWTNLERSVFHTLKDGAKRGWWHIEWMQDGTQALLNGVAHLFFFGMDRPADANKFQSFECGGAWIEEPAPAADLASGVPVDVFAMALSSLSQAGVNIRLQITMNPPQQKHWTLTVTDWIADQNKQHLRVKILWIPKGENPHLAPGYRERLRAGFIATGRLDLLARLADGKVGSVYTGEAVTPEYSDATHIYREDGIQVAIPYSPRWDTFRFWDFGLNPTCIWAQLTPLGNLYILGVVVGKGMGITELITHEVLPYQRALGMHLPFNARDQYGQTTMQTGWKFRDIGDSAANTREQSSSERSAKLALEGLLHTSFEPGPVEWSARRDSVKAALNRNVAGRPFLQLDPTTTEPLQEALRGGWRYGKLPNGKLTPLPIKDEHCMLPDVEMLTTDGWRRYDALTVGQSVYAYEMGRHRLVRSTLEAVHVFDEGPYDAIAFRGQAIEMTVTPGHRCVAAHRWSQGVRFVEAEALDGADMIVRAAPNDLQPKPWYSDDFVRLCAWTMTEGSYRANGAVVISQSLAHNPAYCEELDGLIGRCGGRIVHDRPSGVSRGLTRTWRIAGQVADAVRAVMPAKYPSPAFIARMTSGQRRLFLYEAIRGDGTWFRAEGPIPPPTSMTRSRDFFVRARTPRIFQKSREAIDALQMLCVLAGLRAAVHPKQARVPGWSLSITRQGAWTSVGKLEREHIQAPVVWCPRTSHGTWIARQNGHVFATGNSHPGDALGYGLAVLFPPHEANRRKAPPAPPREIPPAATWMGR